jgi:hypothetical protein
MTELGPDGDFTTLARAAEAMRFAHEHNNRTMLADIVQTLKTRDSPLTKLIGEAFENFFKQHKMID